MKNSHLDIGGVHTETSLPFSVKIFVMVAAALVAMAGITESICRYVLHLGSPYNSPLLNEHFPDLLTLAPRFQHFHTLEFFTNMQDAPCMYPATVAVCYRILFAFSPHDLAAFLCFAILSLVVATTLFGHSLVRHGMRISTAVFLLGFTLLTSFPVWFELKQANMEIFSWVLIALGLWAFMHGRGYSAAACLGIAGACKIIPFFYLGLFVAKKQYRPIFVAILSAALVTVPSLWLVYPNIVDSWRLTNLAVSKFRSVVTLRIYPQLVYDHSVFGLIKRVVFRHLAAQHLSTLLTIYSVTAAAVAVLVFLVWIRKLPVINQILCLCIATLIVPPTSFDYTLMSLYIPWALLVLLATLQLQQGESSPGVVGAMICFAILFAPETEIIVHHQAVAGQIKALTLVALLFIALRYRFEVVTLRSGAAA